MYKLILTFFFVLILNSSQAQYLSLEKLIYFRHSSLANLEDYLTSHGWVFNESFAKTDTTNSSATFAFGREDLVEVTAKLWLHYYDGSETSDNSISYELGSPIEYNKLITRAKTIGYKLVKSAINDDQLIRLYQKGNEVIIFSSKKNEDQSNNTYTRYTAWFISLRDYKSRSHI